MAYKSYRLPINAKIPTHSKWSLIAVSISLILPYHSVYLCQSTRVGLWWKDQAYLVQYLGWTNDAAQVRIPIIL